MVEVVGESCFDDFFEEFADVGCEGNWAVGVWVVFGLALFVYGYDDGCFPLLWKYACVV